MKDADVTDTGETGVAGTATVDVNTGVPVQSTSLGPYSRNVTVDEPDGVVRPVIVATSVIVPPSFMSFDASVEIDGVALVTTTISSGSLHAPLTAALLSSPL